MSKKLKMEKEESVSESKTDPKVNNAETEAMESGDQDTATENLKDAPTLEEKEDGTTPPSGGGETGNTTPEPEPEPVEKECVEFKVVYKKKPYDVKFPLDNTISALKVHIEKLTGVSPSMQKVIFRGLAKDEATLRELKVAKGAKLMVVGSTQQEVQSVSAPDPKEIREEDKGASAKKEPLSQQKQHKKVLEKYPKPDDALPAYKNVKERLPNVPLAGMYNKFGNKVRLTFKLEVDQLWIGTKERTEKVNMTSIKAVVTEPIEGNEEYHMMVLIGNMVHRLMKASGLLVDALVGIQLGPTEASRYWVYWVPAQYVDAIKDTVLGKWQYF